VRVVAGRLGGRRLRAPRGRDTRPTSDRVREALFSMLGPLEGARVLDLFAGSGALAIEALSRGAATARAAMKGALSIKCSALSSTSTSSRCPNTASNRSAAAGSVFFSAAASSSSCAIFVASGSVFPSLPTTVSRMNPDSSARMSAS